MLENNYGSVGNSGSHLDSSAQNQTRQGVVQKMTNSERRKAKYIQLIDSPELRELSSLQKEFLKGRWLDQMNWFSNKAEFYQKWFYWTRLITIVCSVLAPVLISFGTARMFANGSISAPVSDAASANLSSLAASPTPTLTSAPTPATPSTESQAKLQPQQNQISNLAPLAFHTGLFLSQVVAILAAVEQFFKFGDRWRHYRRTAEVLKSHGWQFFQLGGAYAAYAKSGGYKEAFPVFAAQVEEIVQSDVEGFVSQIAVQKQLDKAESSSQNVQ